MLSNRYANKTSLLEYNIKILNLLRTNDVSLCKINNPVLQKSICTKTMENIKQKISKL